MAPARNILVAEDETMIALLLEDFLDLLGHQVTSTVDSVAAGIAAVAAGGFDSAILDVNLGTEKVWPLAEALRDKGVPFVFASGGGDEIPAHLTDRPTLPKPYSMAGLEEALAQLG